MFAGDKILESDFKIGDRLVSPALNQISCKGFATRVEPKAMQVLVYLAGHPGLVTKEQLISAVWPDVFVSDDVLPGCISALRKALHDDARRPKIIETIHKSGYRLLVPVEPVSQKHEEQAAFAKANERLWWHRMLSRREIIVTAGICLFILVGLVLVAVSPRRQYESLAVLPFVNVSGDPATEYLSDGVAQQVVNDLSQLSALRVMAWTTVSHYPKPQGDPRAIGRDLEVKAVLTGRLLRDGDRFVLQTELVDVARGTQLWGQRYERAVSDIPALQQQLSRDIATNLRIRLDAAGRNKLLHRYSASPQAYELYLKGQFVAARRTKQGLEQAIDYFDQAIAIDPNYTLAYAGQAVCYSLLDDWGERAPRDSVAKARAAAAKAIALDNSLSEAHTSQAMVREVYDWDWNGAEQEFKRSIELNPNDARAHQAYGLMLAALGRFADAEAEVKHAQQLDPMSPIINMAVAEVYAWERRYDQAIEQYNKAIALDPTFARAHENVAYAYEQEHRYAEAVRALQQQWYLNGDPSFAQVIARSYSTSGYSAVLRQQLDRFLRLRASGQYVDPVEIAGSYAELGNEAQAFDWLKKGYEDHSSGMRFLSVVPDFDSLRTNPQFQYWLGVLNLPVIKINTVNREGSGLSTDRNRM
jgi:TolB-like protein/DNA-binding winged helix-turn-helix (wHTH) protein/Tfp pilus assembly protein PilF